MKLENVNRRAPVSSFKQSENVGTVTWITEAQMEQEIILFWCELRRHTRYNVELHFSPYITADFTYPLVWAVIMRRVYIVNANVYSTVVSFSKVWGHKILSLAAGETDTHSHSHTASLLLFFYILGAKFPNKIEYT